MWVSGTHTRLIQVGGVEPFPDCLPPHIACAPTFPNSSRAARQAGGQELPLRRRFCWEETYRNRLCLLLGYRWRCTTDSEGGRHPDSTCMEDGHAIQRLDASASYSHVHYTHLCQKTNQASKQAIFFPPLKQPAHAQACHHYHCLCLPLTPHTLHTLPAIPPYCCLPLPLLGLHALTAHLSLGCLGAHTASSWEANISSCLSVFSILRSGRRRETEGSCSHLYTCACSFLAYYTSDEERRYRRRREACWHLGPAKPPAPTPPTHCMRAHDGL